MAFEVNFVDEADCSDNKAEAREEMHSILIDYVAFLLAQVSW